MSTDGFTIRRPDDWHVHLRDGELLERVVPFTANVFARALVMPNLTPPVLTGQQAVDYKRRIEESRMSDCPTQPDIPSFEPLMTIKLTDKTTPTTIAGAHARGVIAAKLYPAGVTTNSADGVTKFEVNDLRPVLEVMEELGMILCIHAETPNVTSLNRESHFVDRYVTAWALSFPRLKIVVEHATTRQALTVARSLPNVGCTLTVHHMLVTLDDVIGDKLDPHCFCKPIAKSEEDRQAIIEAAVGGDPSFFLGTDSAPHLACNKHAAQAAAGCFTAPVALQLLAQVFEERGSLNTLEMFTSENGARFYGLPLNTGKVRLVKRPSAIPRFYTWRDDSDRRVPEGQDLVPFWHGRGLSWDIDEVTDE